MHLYQALVSLCVVLTVASDAAPLARNEVASRSLIDDVSDVLFERVNPADFKVAKYKPVPKNSLYKTQTNSYTGKEVNSAARNARAHAVVGRKSEMKYPSDSSGFHAEDRSDPTGNYAKGKKAVHSPIRNKNSDLSHSPNGIGPDRVILHKGPKDKKFTGDVAYHDTKKPKSNNGAGQHHMTGAKIRLLSKTQMKHEKVKAHLAKPPKPFGHVSKPKAPSMASQKKHKFAKYKSKAAQKLGVNRLQKKLSAAAKKKVQRKETHWHLKQAQVMSKNKHKEKQAAEKKRKATERGKKGWY